MSGKPYSLFSAFCLPQLPGERAGGLMKFRDRVLGWVYVKGPVIERVEESFNKACISLYLCKLSPHSTWFLLLLLKPLLCCFSAHLLDPDHSWVFFNTLNLYYTMPCARIFPSRGREKNPKPTKTLWLGFLSSWLALSQDFIPIIKVAWQTENKPLAHPELTVYHFQVRTNTK